VNGTAFLMNKADRNATNRETGCCGFANQTFQRRVIPGARQEDPFVNPNRNSGEKG
jgi:hypothetical protein